MAAAWRVLREARQMLRPESYWTGSAQQERLDILRLYLLIEARRSWPTIRIRTLDDVEDTAPRMHQQKAAVTSNAISQLVEMLDGWNTEQPPPLPPDVQLPDDTQRSAWECAPQCPDAAS
jgi:hypothetical protein